MVPEGNEPIVRTRRVCLQYRLSIIGCVVNSVCSPITYIIVQVFHVKEGLENQLIQPLFLQVQNYEENWSE